MKFVFIILTALSLNSFANNNLTGAQSKQIAKKLNAENVEAWTNGNFSVQFDYVLCPSDKSQCAFAFKMWPAHKEVETLEGSYNGRGKGFYWSATVLERGLVNAKCTLKSLETYEEIVTTHGDLRADVVNRMEDCVGRVSKISSK